MAQVFISFIHEEAGYAEAVQAFITQILGPEAKPFLSSDKLQVYAGEKWLDRIMDELKEAKVVILMLSTESMKRPWVNFEAGAAWTREIKTIPVCFGGLGKDFIPKPYSNLQAVDLQSYGDDEYLARSVAHHLGVPEPVDRRHAAGLAVLGGMESEKRFEREKNAYKNLAEALRKLNMPGSLDKN